MDQQKPSVEESYLWPSLVVFTVFTFGLFLHEQKPGNSLLQNAIYLLVISCEISQFIR